MQAVVKKWGNSLALRLPQNVAASLNIEDGTTVDLVLGKNGLTLRPARKKFELSDLLAKHKRAANHDDPHHKDPWGKPVGKETW